MINDLVNSILKAEADAARLIEEANANANEILKNNKSDIDKMFASARVDLSAAVVRITDDAEVSARAQQQEEKKQSAKNIDALEQKVNTKFGSAVQYLQAQFKNTL